MFRFLISNIHFKKPAKIVFMSTIGAVIIEIGGGSKRVFSAESQPQPKIIETAIVRAQRNIVVVERHSTGVKAEIIVQQRFVFRNCHRFGISFGQKVQVRSEKKVLLR